MKIFFENLKCSLQIVFYANASDGKLLLRSSKEKAFQLKLSLSPLSKHMPFMGFPDKIPLRQFPLSKM